MVILSLALLVVALVLLARFSRRLWLRPFSLDGKVVVLTGGASGIGRALAERIWRTAAGVTLVLLDVDAAALETAKTNLQATPSTNSTEQGKSTNRVLTYQCDVSDESQVASCIAGVKDAVAPKTINVLVNNAGIVNGKDITDLSATQLQRIFGVNVLAHIYLVKHVLPLMKQSDAECMIVSVASLFSLMPGCKLADYCATKAAVMGFHNALRLELLRDGFANKIRTLIVYPLGVRTGMFDGIFDADRGIFDVQKIFGPVLSQEVAVASIHKAMLDGELEVISCHPGLLGDFLQWVIPMLRLLPIPLQNMHAASSGMLRGMDSFVGHTGKKQ